MIVNMKKINRNQFGLSLIELMVGIVIGLIIIAGATSVFIGTIGSSSTTLKMSKLNQELSTVMSVMTGDIRRAGYDSSVTDNAPQDNKFNQFGDSSAAEQLKPYTALSVRLSQADPTNNPGTIGSGECILYTYDQNKDGAVNNSEFFGFRLNNSVLEMREPGSVTVLESNAIVAKTAQDDCDKGTWVEVTDGDLINISTLTFDLSNAHCLNITKQDGIDNDADTVIDEDDEINCYTTVPVFGSGDVTVEARMLAITLTGNLVNDSLIRSTLSHTVRVRNDLVRIR